MRTRKRILITVKTYPQPSTKYFETVCVAGVCENGDFIRIYPMPFRELEEADQFKKYQWVEVEVERNTSDPRPESYRAFPSTLELGRFIDSKRWDERVHCVFKSNKIMTACELNTKFGKDMSLAITRPRKVVDLIIEKDSDDWSTEQKEGMRQTYLDGRRCNLEKIPWKFKYRYYCESIGCGGHNQTIEDWELFQLYRKMRRQYSEEVALEKVKQKFLNEMCSADRDVHFFMGMHNKYRVWMVIGLFCPPKKTARQLPLF